MKVLFQFSTLFVLLTSLLSAQPTCLNITVNTQAYLNLINQSHTIFPVGSILFQTGDIRIIKVDTITTFISASNDSICYIGRLEMNVSTAPYTQRRLTFYSIITQGLVIDGDTLFSNWTPMPFYNGNGFTCTYANNIFTITGTFDVAHIFGSTNCVYAPCLSPDTVSTSTCLNITTGTQTYMNSINQNHTLYPVGSVLFQTGDIRIIKADTITSFINASNDTICYIGRLEMNVSTAPYAQRRLTFYSIITQGLVIDGDTLFSNTMPPPVYNGNGFTCTYANNVFTILGAFDVAHIFGSTNCVYAPCLSPDTVSTSTCLNITTGTQTYINSINQNHTLYPVGSVLFQTGDIRIIKADTITSFINASNDSICYIGRLEMNVSTAPYTQRRLTFYSTITQGLVIDGDTLFSNMTPLPMYNGNGFTCTYVNNIFTITGAFDVVHIFGSTNCISGVCLEALPTATSDMMDDTSSILLYPNPAHDVAVLHADGISFDRVWIWNLQGIRVYQENANGSHHTLELSTLPNGFYIWQVMDTNGTLHSGRLRIGQ